jgi:predicted DNA-binding transcriptional regulator AlpA
MHARSPIVTPGPHSQDQLLRAQEVAAILAVSPRQVWKFRSVGRLPAVQIAGSTRFRASDVRRLIEEGTKGGGR